MFTTCTNWMKQKKWGTHLTELPRNVVLLQTSYESKSIGSYRFSGPIRALFVFRRGKSTRLPCPNQWDRLKPFPPGTTVGGCTFACTKMVFSKNTWKSTSRIRFLTAFRNIFCYVMSRSLNNKPQIDTGLSDWKPWGQSVGAAGSIWNHADVSGMMFGGMAKKKHRP